MTNVQPFPVINSQGSSAHLADNQKIAAESDSLMNQSDCQPVILDSTPEISSISKPSDIDKIPSRDAFGANFELNKLQNVNATNYN